MNLKINKLLCVVLTLSMLISILPNVGIIAYAKENTGNAITSDSFASTDRMWSGNQTSNLIPTPTLPDYNTGEGKDKAKWQNFWNNTMVPAGWGSAGVSGEDDALQVYSKNDLDGNATFAIRPVDGGDASSDANLGGAGEDSCRSTGVSYTVKLDSNAKKLANEGKLITTAKAEFYRQKGYLYRFGLTFEFYNASGTKLSGVGAVPTYNSSGKVEIDSNDVYVNWYVFSADADGYLSRWASNVKVPKGTAYIRYWYANLGGGNDRKAIQNIQAYLVTPHSIQHAGWTEYTGNKEETTIIKDTNIYLSSNTTLSGKLIISSGSTVNLCLNGNTLDLGANNMANHGTLIICDCQNTHGTIKSADSYAMYNDGTITMTEGNVSADNGYGIYNDGGTITMTEGNISSVDRVGIYNIDGGTIIMKGGTVTSGSSYGISNYGIAKISGGSVNGTTGIPNYSSGTLEISGTATVTGTSTNGITNAGTLTMTGGTVASSENRGIYNNGTANISGGKVKGTTGIYNNSEKTLEISGSAKITGDTGISNSGTLTMTGGTVESTGDTGNGIYNTGSSAKATVSGGSVISKCYGIYNSYNGTLTMTGGTVTSSEHVGIYNNASGSISGGEISAAVTGVQNGSAKTLEISGSAKITGATGHGIQNNGILTMKAGSVISETSYGIYNLSTADISGGDIKGETGIENDWYSTVKISGTVKVTGTKSYGISTYGTLTMTGGTVTSSRSDGIAIGEGSASISGGEVSGTTGIMNSIECTLEISGNAKVTGAAEYGIDNYGLLYLSGSPEISGYESYADIKHYYGSERFISATNVAGDSEYQGEVLTVSLLSEGYTVGNVIVKNVNDTTDDYFILVGNDNYKFARGTDENVNDLIIIKLKHKHVWASTWSNDENGHWHECTASDCDISDYSQVTDEGCGYAKHSGGTATCNASAVCTFCSKSYGSTNGTSHNFGTPTYKWADDYSTCTAERVCSFNEAHKETEMTSSSSQITQSRTCLVPELTKYTAAFVNSAFETQIKDNVETKGALSHSYTYTADGAVITEKCTNGCTHSETATIVNPAGTLAYNGSPFEASVTYSDNWQGGTLNIVYNDNVNAGNVTATITKDSVSATVNYTIEKQTVAEPSISSKTFDGDTLTADIPESSLYNVSANLGGVNAGFYNVELTLTDVNNYKWSTTDDATVTLKFEIKKATNTFTTFPSIVSWTYGETPRIPTGLAVFGEVEFTYFDSEYRPLDAQPTNAGNYYMKATVLAGTPITRASVTNYDAISSDFIPFTIAKAQVAKPIADATVFTYNGSEQAYTIAGNANYTVNGNTQINAGNYVVAVSLKDTANYEWTDGSITNLTYDFVINKANYDMSEITFDNAQFDYDGEAHSLVIGGTLPTGLDGIQVTVAYSGSATNVADGEQTVTATFATESTNYNVPTAMNAKVKINPKNISGAVIELDNSLTYTGSEQTQNIKQIVVDGLNATYDIANNKQTNVGVSDYILAVTGNGNFTGIITKNWNIAKANAEITIDTTPIVKTYGDVWTLPVATTNFGTVVCDKVIGDLANAGTYTVAYSVAGTDNYNGDIKEVSVTINPRIANDVPATATTLTYGQTLATSTLTSGWEWADSTVVPTVINSGYTAYYAIADDTNYDWSAIQGYNSTEHRLERVVAVTVAQATPTITNPTVSPVRIGNALSTSTFTGGEAKGVGDAELTGTFAWKDGTEVMNTNGTFSRKVVFTPTDTNYAPCEFDVDVEVYTPSSGGGTTRYTVKFDTDGGSTIKNASVTRNSKVTKPVEPTKDGYVFNGWYTDKELTEKYDFESKVTKSFTLYASWSEIIVEPDPDIENPGTDVSELKWNQFIDVNENDWFCDAVKDAYINGLIKGTSENTFLPNGDITRGMFVTILYRAEGEPAVNKSIPFVDVKADDYFANAVIWAQQNKIVKGISENEFAPNSNITREQMAAILYRYALYKGVTPATTLAYHLGKFTDKDNISEYAITALDWAVSGNIISGKGNGILDPLGNATRAEATAVLVRFLNIIK